MAVLHDKQSYGQGIAASVRDELKKANVEVALFEGINIGDELLGRDHQAQSAGADLCTTVATTLKWVCCCAEAAEQGLKVRMMGPEGVGATLRSTPSLAMPSKACW